MSLEDHHDLLGEGGTLGDGGTFVGISEDGASIVVGECGTFVGISEDGVSIVVGECGTFVGTVKGGASIGIGEGGIGPRRRCASRVSSRRLTSVEVA
jgi:hypothetical protein